MALIRKLGFLDSIGNLGFLDSIGNLGFLDSIGNFSLMDGSLKKIRIPSFVPANTLA